MGISHAQQFSSIGICTLLNRFAFAAITVVALVDSSASGQLLSCGSLRVIEHSPTAIFAIVACQSLSLCDNVGEDRRDYESICHRSNSGRGVKIASRTLAALSRRGNHSPGLRSGG